MIKWVFALDTKDRTLVTRCRVPCDVLNQSEDSRMGALNGCVFSSAVLFSVRFRRHEGD